MSNSTPMGDPPRWLTDQQLNPGYLPDHAAAYTALSARYASAVRTLQDIAAMGRKAGSESAKHRLIQLGEPIEPEGM